MRYAIRGLAALASLALLGGCGTFDSYNDQRGLETASAQIRPTVSDEPVKLGTVFTVGSVAYTPQDTPAYDEVGYTGRYGAEMPGRPTANGEIFNPGGATAAHKTLPMPSYVEVTALDTGRTILVRINDRGPLANDRLIDLSEGAARQLGIAPQGVFGVRVRRVNPPEQEKEVLRQGITAAERIETPEPLLKILRDKLAKQPKPVAMASAAAPAPTKTAAPPTQAREDDGRFVREVSGSTPRKAVTVPVTASGGDYVVQVAALSSRSRADALARKLGAWVTASADGRLFRVRLGPYASETAAQQGLATARAKGYPQARIYRD